MTRFVPRALRGQRAGSGPAHDTAAGTPPRPRTGSSRRAQAGEAAVARLRRTAVALVAWIVVSALVGGAAWYFKQQSDVIETARGAALAAAEQAAEAIFSYDYRAFDESVSNGKRYVTGDFAGEYTRITASLKAMASKEKAIVRAGVSAKGASEVTPERVEVLLFVNQYKRNINITGEKVDENRVVLTMVYVPDRSGGGEWLAAGAVAI
jgi:Mce-associated membrane protein